MSFPFSIIFQNVNKLSFDSVKEAKNSTSLSIPTKTKISVKMDFYINLNNQTQGKDKIARLIQYSCRALWDSLNSKDDAQLVLIQQLKTLENLLSSFRKCKEKSLSI